MIEIIMYKTSRSSEEYILGFKDHIKRQAGSKYYYTTQTARQSSYEAAFEHWNEWTKDNILLIEYHE